MNDIEGSGEPPMNDKGKEEAGRSEKPQGKARDGKGYKIEKIILYRSRYSFLLGGKFLI